MGAAAQRAGLRALVIDGYLRDLAGLEKLELPIFYWGTAVAPARDFEVVAVNQPLVCARAWVHPGDLVAIDRDGGLVIPPEHLAAVAQNVQEIAALEVEQGVIVRERGSLEDLTRVLAAKQARREG